MKKLAPLLVLPWVLLLAHCSDTQSVECPCGQQLNADGSDCEPIPCEGGDLSSCACVCPGDQTLADGICTDTACIDVDCDDGKECTDDDCQGGVCGNDNVADGTDCDSGAGVCINGVCVEDTPCTGVDCTSQNECVGDGTCNPADGLCIPGNNKPKDTTCTEDGGTFCDGGGACVQCILATDCDLGAECTERSCSDGKCNIGRAEEGATCDFEGGDGNGQCSGGTCVASTCDPLCNDRDTDPDDCLTLRCVSADCVPDNIPEGEVCRENNEDGLCDEAGNCNVCASKEDGTSCDGGEGVCRNELCSTENLWSCDTSGVNAALDRGGSLPHYFKCDDNSDDVFAPAADGFLVDKDVILDGRGKLTLTGRNGRRVLLVDNDVMATLREIVITEGSADDGGGIVARGGSSVTLYDCVVSLCTASDDGGGIVVGSGATVTLFRTTVGPDNIATDDGGGILANGALTLDDSTVTTNMAINGNGGGLLIGSSGTATIRNSSVIEFNNSGDDGGGIRVFRSAMVNIEDSVFYSNTAADRGGAIASYGDSAGIVLIETKGSTFDRNNATNNGGAIFAEGTNSVRSTVNLSNTTVSNNDADAAGGIYVFGGTVNLTNSTVSGNISGTGASAAFRLGGYSGSSRLNLKHCTIANNDPTDDSKVDIVVSSGSATVEGTIVEGSCSGAVSSDGGNVESPDDTCSFDMATDLRNQPDLNLGVLTTNYGGTTETHLPGDGSPAIDSYPTAAGACLVDDDQLSEGANVRPAGDTNPKRCDSGSVEVR